jgi:hypothetical protein
MDELKYKALELGASDLGLSQVKTKKYYVIYNEKKINFGSAHMGKRDWTIKIRT